MRISDWSSDVCSSDLAFLIAVRGSIVALQLDQRGDLESQLLDLAFQDFELLRLRIENLVAGGAIGDERLGIIFGIDQCRTRRNADHHRAFGYIPGDRKSTRLNSSH